MDALENIFGEALKATESKEIKTESAAQSVVFDERNEPIKITEPMSRLVAYVMSSFRSNADHRRASGVDARLRKCLLAYTCNYSEEQKAKMKAVGLSEDLYSPVTHTKIRAAKALMGDIFQSSNDLPFSLIPSPNPELPQEVEEQVMQYVGQDIQKIFAQLQNSGLQEIPPQAYQQFMQIVQNAVATRSDEITHMREDIARKRCKRMEKKVHDILFEGGWVDAFQDYVNHICVYGTGLIIGPVPKVVAVNAIEKDKKTGVSKYVRKYKEIPTYEAINPCDAYPAPDAKTVNDGALCIRIRYSASELWKYTQKASEKDYHEHHASGWIPSVVNNLLSKNPSGGIHLSEENRDPTIRTAEKHGSEDFNDCTFEGVRCFATIRGSELLEIGVLKTREGKAIQPREYYQAEIIVIGGYVVYVRILDERLGRPISKGVFYELPDSWWGEAIAEKLFMVQNVMNNCIKSLLMNMAAASGPMYWINDVSRLNNREMEGLKIRPHKMWAFQTSMMGNSGAPMGVIQVPSNASELLAVFDKLKMQADDDSGIPAYTYGQAQGAGAAMRTAQGLSIFTEAASRGMKMVINTTDRLVIRNVIKKTADYVLLYDDDMDIKGDCEVIPTGVMGKILKAQQDQERVQVLGMVINNQMLTQICGIKGIMALLRPSIVDININPDDVLPSDERVRELEMIQDFMQVAQAQAAQGQAQQAQMGAQQAQIQQEVPQTGGQVMQPGDQPPSVPTSGGVAQRRGVA